MNSRWSADSSTNETTADSPRRRRGERGQPRVVEAHRDLGREVLEQVAGQAELGEHDEARAAVARLGEQLVVAREVLLELPEPRRDLGESDAERLHAPSLGLVVSARRRDRLDRGRSRAAALGGVRRRRRPSTAGRPPRAAGAAATSTGTAAARRGRRRRASALRPVAWSCSREPSTSSAKWHATSWPVDSVRSSGILGGAALRVAEPLAQPAAGVEAAARRRVDRRRHVALEDDPPAAPLDLRVRDRDRRQQRDRVRVERPRLSSRRRRQLDDPAEVHHRDPVADVADDRQVVGDEQVRQPEPALEPLEQVDDLRLDRDVEGADRLVGDDEVRVEGERPGDADALPLAARELVRVALARSRG